MPKPFVFRLEKVLDYRRQLADQARMALAQAQARHQEQEAVVLDLEERLAGLLEKGFGAKATQADIWLWMQYRQALERDLASAKAELQRLALILQNCRQEAVLRSREKKLLEKLKDRQAKKHHVAENLAEQKEFDEMSTLRHEPKDP
ncbi:MAG: flagellar export protein FliJ [Proteobacteria bacterium]|nr:flagellar export protein FliJ [Pseudomonadota bacterium]MBU1596628.1 flagellar export protein FliJ [Pseudomonadota bacterium]